MELKSNIFGKASKPQQRENQAELNQKELNHYKSQLSKAEQEKEK